MIVSERAQEYARNFKNRTFSPWTTGVGDLLKCRGEPILRRHESGFEICWPKNLYSYGASQLTQRSILNGVLKGLQLHHWYRFSIHGRAPCFWMKDMRGTFRRQPFSHNTWYPLIEGDLARLAHYETAHKQLDLDERSAV